MAERVRIIDVPRQVGQWLYQRPPYPYDFLNRRGLYWLNRPVLQWKDPNPSELRRRSTRVFITGHAVDHDMQGRAPRFEDKWKNIQTAKTRIHAELDGIYTLAQGKRRNLELVFCSGTTGTDLLALQWALGKMKAAKEDPTSPQIAVRVFLGYDKETFIDDSVRLSDHKTRHQKMWFNIFNELDNWGEGNLVVEPEFRGPLRRRRNNPRPPADAPKGKRFKDQIKREFARRYGTKDDAYKYFDEMNDRMVRYLRKGDYALALWDGNAPFGRGGTVYALNAAHRRIRDESHIRFIDPRGIIHQERLGNEISLRRVQEIVAKRKK